MTNARVIRVIPAAGAGRRMGATKALLDFEGQSALSLVISLDLGDRIARDVVVVGHEGDRVAAEAERLGCEPVLNEAWDRGQTSSLQLGLARALERDATHIVVHPVDLPMVTQFTYNACAPVMEEAPITVPSFKMRRGHPLIITRPIAEEILALPIDTPARRVIRSHPDEITYVNVDDPWVVRDLDHPADYEDAAATFRTR